VKAPSIHKLKAYLSRDPFNEAGVAQYKMVGVDPMKSDPRVRTVLTY
jgi:hypothetical protein